MAAPPVMLWRGHASRGLVGLILVAHALGLLWLCGSWQRLRLLTYDFREVPNESLIMQSPEALRAFGYVEDDPTELRQVYPLAEAITRGAGSDGERIRRLGDYIYSMRRPGRPDADDEPRIGLAALFEQLRQGQVGSCAQDSLILATFWRSLGGHTRGVRWADVDGATFHFATELYSSGLRRWMYYDMNLNGYGTDDDGLPVPVTSLRSRLLAGEDLYLTANPTARDWTPREFQEFLEEYPVEWYVLNNSLLASEPSRRFGRLNRLYPMLSRLPYPADRIADNLLGARDRRLVVEGKVRIGGLLSFTGARLFLAYLLAQIALCASTLLLSTRTRP